MAENFDTGAVTDIWREIPALISLSPIESREVIRKEVFALLHRPNHLCHLVCEVVTAGGAKEIRCTFQPSDFLLRLVSALRAQKYDFTAFKHELASLELSSKELSQESSPSFVCRAISETPSLSA
jgi:hypothetical protein